MKNKKNLLGIFILVGAIFLAGCAHCPFGRKKDCCDCKEKKCDTSSTDVKKEVTKENVEQK